MNNLIFFLWATKEIWITLGIIIFFIIYLELKGKKKNELQQ